MSNFSINVLESSVYNYKYMKQDLFCWPKSQLCIDNIAVFVSDFSSL